MGVLMLLGYSSWAPADNRVWVGDLLFLLSSALAAAYLVYVQQQAVDPMQATALVSAGIFIAGVLAGASAAKSAPLSRNHHLSS